MKTEPQPLDVIQGRRQVGVIFKVAPSGMGGRGGWAFKNMDTGRLFTFARLQEAKDEAWKSFAGCIFKRQKPLARLAPYARGTVAEPRGENPEPSKLAKSWASFDFWFFNDGHWVYGTGAKGYANAVEHWKGHGIIGRGDYPGPRPANVYAGLPVHEYQTYMQRVAEESGIASERAKNPLPSPANIIANVALTTAARAVAGRFMNSLFDGGKGDASATDAGDAMPALTREENPVKKGGTLYTDHRGLAFRIHPRGRDTWQIIGAEGLGSRVGGALIGHVEKRGDGLYYVGIPAVGQWWKPTGKNLRAAANYVLSESDAILGIVPRMMGDARADNPRARTTRDVFVVQGNYGYGWDDEVEENTKREALARLKEYRENGGGQYRLVKRREKIAARAANPSDIHIDIQSHNTKGKNVRAKNPASAAKIVLALAGHPKGTGYYTGQTWDTELRKAIRFDSVTGAKAAAKLLAAKLPKGTRIEVRSIEAAGK